MKGGSKPKPRPGGLPPPMMMHPPINQMPQRRIMPRRILPPPQRLAQKPMPRKLSKSSEELDDVLKKLKEIGK